MDLLYKVVVESGILDTGGVKYDGKDFLTFPQRCGWQSYLDLLNSFDFTNNEKRTIEEAVRTLKAWLLHVSLNGFQTQWAVAPAARGSRT